MDAGSAAKELSRIMAKTKIRRSSAQQAASTAATMQSARATSGRRAIQKRQPRTGLAAFIRDFPVLTTILSLAIIGGLVTVLFTNHVGPFAVAKAADPCAWATNPGSIARPATIVRTYSAAPRNCITKNSGGLYKATIHTSKGDIVMVLDQRTAPITVNNFVFLASHHFYDATTFHRVEHGIVQGGDPYTADLSVDKSKYGTGGPGYTIPDEFPSSNQAYAARGVAMANSGSGTTGSQFFIATADDTYLQPQYNYLGRVTPQSFPVAQGMQIGIIMQSVTISFDPHGVSGVDNSTPVPATPSPVASPAPSTTPGK